MLTQSKKEIMKRKELKGMVMAMSTYIDSLMNLGALLISQARQSFDPNSIDRQQLVKQMKRGKLLSDAMQDWVNSIIKEGNKFILDFNSTYAKGETLLGEIQTLTLGWESDKNRCQAIVF